MEQTANNEEQRAEVDNVRTYPFLEANDANLAYRKIFKEIYTYKEFSDLELLQFGVDRSHEVFTFEIGVVSEGKLKPIVWEYGKSYKGLENCTIVCGGNMSSQGYVVMDMEEVLRQTEILWNKKNKATNEYLSRPEYKLNYKKIADIEFSPQIRLHLMSHCCRFVDNFPLDNNILEFYIEGENAESKGFYIGTGKNDREEDVMSYVSKQELVLYVFDSSGLLSFIYKKREDDNSDFAYCEQTIKDENGSDYTFHIVFRYGWEPQVDLFSRIDILPSAYNLSLNPYISTYICRRIESNNNRAYTDGKYGETYKEIRNLEAKVNSEIKTNADDIKREMRNISMTLPDGSVTEDKLSAGVKSLIKSCGGGVITNHPDDYFLTANEDNQITIADRAVMPYRQGFVVVRTKGAFDTECDTTYFITDNIDLGDGELNLKRGTCLKIMGGSISNGTIRGDGSIIDAPEYRIFYGNVKITGNFANAFPIEWWGAVASSSVDSAPAINAAIQSMVINNMETTNLLEAVNLVAHGTEYHIDSTIMLNKKGISLHFDGNVVASSGVTAFDVSQHHISLKVRNLKSELKETDTPVASCSGVRISYNCYHSDFDIHAVCNFGKGFNLCPRCKNNNDNEVAGIQYCKFTFQELVNVENIVFDLDGINNGKGLWINENQFFGGRVGGSINGKDSGYGIRFYGSHISKDDAEKKGAYDWVNGNVFYSIGFEAVEHPIYGLWRWCNDQFHDLRMSESIDDEKYITLGNCESLRFSVKSNLYAYHVDLNSEDEIEKEWYAMSVSVEGDSDEKNTFCTDVIFEDPTYVHYIDGNVVKSIKISDIYNGGEILTKKCYEVV